MTEQTKWESWEAVPLVLGVKEAAALLSVHENTIKNMIHRGDLPAAKVGRAWRIKRETVRAMLEDTYEPPTVLASSADEGQDCGGLL